MRPLCFELQILLWGSAASGVGSLELWRCEHRSAPRPGERRRLWDASPSEREAARKRLGGIGGLTPTWGLPYVELARERKTIDTRRAA